jgi:proteasome accessory factor C
MSKATPSQTAARLLDLVPFIYTHQGIEIAELAKHFGISQSELMANLNSLWMCGESRFDLVELDFESGFVHIRNAEAINLVRSLSIQEIIAILFGLDLLQDEIRQDRPDLLMQLTEIRTLLGGNVQPLVTASTTIEGSLLRTIDDAISRRKKLLLTYHSISDDLISKRVVQPIERSFVDGHEFLRAYCESADALRTFRLDRVLSVSEIDVPAAPKSTHNSSTQRLSVKVRIHGGIRAALETLGDASEIGDGQYELSIFNPSWLIREVMAAGGSIEVLEPQELRQEIARQVQTVANLYP